MHTLLVKKVLEVLGFDARLLNERLGGWSLKMALCGNGYNTLVQKLRGIVTDISDQESSTRDTFNNFWEFKRRVLQSFQCKLMLRALNTR
mgnify:FL=1